MSDEQVQDYLAEVRPVGTATTPTTTATSTSRTATSTTSRRSTPAPARRPERTPWDDLVAPLRRVDPDSAPAGRLRRHRSPAASQIGNTGLWILDYTTEPENGGLGVFAHEFAHDLGVPDYYDTHRRRQQHRLLEPDKPGSWLGSGEGTPGTTPNHVGASDKLSLGWYGPNELDRSSTARRARPGGRWSSARRTAPTTTGTQAVRRHLPDGEETVAGPRGQSSDDGAYLYSDNREAVGRAGHQPRSSRCRTCPSRC